MARIEVLEQVGSARRAVAPPQLVAVDSVVRRKKARSVERRQIECRRWRAPRIDIRDELKSCQQRSLLKRFQVQPRQPRRAPLAPRVARVDRHDSCLSASGSAVPRAAYADKL